jgi:hypothetical protein
LLDTTRRLIARALWRRRDPIAHDRTDLGRDSNRCVPVHEVSLRSSPARSQRRERPPARLRRRLRSDVSYRLQASVVRTSEATSGFWYADLEYSSCSCGLLAELSITSYPRPRDLDRMPRFRNRHCDCGTKMQTAWNGWFQEYARSDAHRGLEPNTS